MSQTVEGFSGPDGQEDFSKGVPTTVEPSGMTWIDRIGAALAGICAVHCFAFMLGSIIFGFSAPNLFFNPGLRWLMVFLLACLSVGSFMAHGRHHGQAPAWLMAGGLIAIISANLMGIWSLTGEVLCLCGGLVLAAGHWLQLSRAKRVHEPMEESAGSNLSNKLAFLLIALASMMALFQLSSNTLFRNGSPGTEANEDIVGWRVLAQLDTQTGDIGPDLKKAIGNQVRVPGFVVPLDEGGKSFLLAPYAGACIHGPTPPMNQIIFVEMQAKATPIDPWSWDPIWVTGTLEVMEIHSPFGSAGFKMDGISTEIYK